MIVYRLTKKKYATDLSGKGAELFGGRWNLVGIPALYTSANRALSILELLAHTPKHIIPPSFELLEIEIPEKYDSSIIKITDLPDNWNALQTTELTQEIGRVEFEINDNLGIIVPSVIIEQESNIILNPRNKHFNKIKIIESVEIKLDERLMNL